MSDSDDDSAQSDFELVSVSFLLEAKPMLRLGVWLATCVKRVESEVDDFWWCVSSRPDIGADNLNCHQLGVLSNCGRESERSALRDTGMVLWVLAWRWRAL
jgi:hypothetical protein